MPNLKTLLAIGAISSLGVLAGSIIAPIEARYISSFTDSPVVVGSVFGIASIFLAVLSFYIGRLSDRYGRRRLILFGLITGVIYALVYSAVLNVFQIYAVKFAWALSAVATGPIMAAYLQDFLEPYKNKGAYFGYIYSAQSISGSVGALMGGYMAEVYGLTAPLYGVAAIFALLFVVAYLFLPNSIQESAPLEKARTPDMSPRQTFHYMASKPELLFYLSVNTSFGVNWGIKAFLWPLIIFELAQSDLITGSIFATMGAVAFVLLPFAGKFVDKYGPYKIIFVELLVLGVSGTGLVLSNSVSVFWIFAAIYTIGEVLNGPAQSVLLTENVDSKLRGTVMGLDAAMDQILGVLAPLFAGLLIAISSLTIALAAFVALFWVSLLCSGLLYRRIPAEG